MFGRDVAIDQHGADNRGIGVENGSGIHFDYRTRFVCAAHYGQQSRAHDFSGNGEQARMSVECERTLIHRIARFVMLPQVAQRADADACVFAHGIRVGANNRARCVEHAHNGWCHFENSSQFAGSAFECD